MIAGPVPVSAPMKGFGVGLSCAAVLAVVACASAEVDQAPFLGDTAGRGAAGGGNRSTAGSAGRVSQSGTAGSGAPFNGAGGAGVAGASGGTSSVGSAGMSDPGGAGAGAGGAAPIFESGVCASSPSMSLSYLQASNNPKQITARYQFSNTTDTPIPLAQLKIRYFFTDEETSGWSTAIYDAKLDGGTGNYRPLPGSVLAVSPLGTRVPGADSYIELSFSSPLSIERGAIATVSWDLQPHVFTAPDQVQTDDYSYNAAAVDYTVWDHVVIYQGGNLIWGCTPKAIDGSGGAGGASTGGTANGGTSGTVNGGTSGAGATDAGSSGAGVGGTGGGAGAAGASSGGSSGAAGAGGLGVSGASGSSGLGGSLNAGAGTAGSSGGTSSAP